MPYAVRTCPSCSKPFRPRSSRPTCWGCELQKKYGANVAPLDAPDGAVIATGKPQPALADTVRNLLMKAVLSVDELAEELDMRPSERSAVVEAIETLISGGYNLIQRPDGRYRIDRDAITGGQSDVVLTDRGDGWSVLGFTSDNHLGSKHERLDVLNKLYDIFAAEGVTDVYNGGNWIEGEARFNKHDIKVFGLDNQIDYFVENFPQRDGITTHYVAGDDHEGWYQQREAINIGSYMEMRARRAGRTDLHYLGYVEADIALTTPTGAVAPMRVAHGGGGSSYALSYTLQKMVESYQGGEKPAILAVGHYHKFAYCYPRNVHAFLLGCTEDQSIFMRKQKIEAHVGGVLARIKQNRDTGHVEQFEVRWIPFYDRGFYERRFE